MSAPAAGDPYEFGERIERVVAHHAWIRPEATAVQQGERVLSYGELVTRGDEVAAALRRLGIMPGQHVAVCMPRSLELVAVLLGILRAGAAYAAVDPRWPQERIEEAVCGASTALLVTEGSHKRAGGHRDRVRVLTPSRLLEMGRGAAPPAPLEDGGATASIFYTSGSTGKPKGVLSPHRGTIRTLVRCPTIPLGPDSAFLQAAPLAWDGLSLELWAPLLNGGRCVLLDQAVASLDAEALSEVVRRGVNSLWLTSSLFNVISEERCELFGSIRLLLVGGERVSVANARRVLTAFPHLHVVNGYGPAESTIFATNHVIRSSDIAEGSTEIPIGTPVPRTTVALLDGDGQPVKDGEIGEVTVGGDGVALGYADNPEESARRFSSDGGIRFYRTGDLALRDAEGLLRYRGRVDSQFKIRGVRVEAAEVEAVLEGHPEVTACCAVPLETAPGRTELGAVYTSARHEPLEEAELKEFAARYLLDAMVPALLAHAAELPLNANGKADREAVRALLRTHAGKAGAPARPATRQNAVLQDVRAVLGLTHVAADDDLILAGANSLDVIRLAARTGLRLGARLTASDVYRLRTLRAIADHCEHATSPREQLPGPAHDTPASAPLSHAQRRFWIAEKSSPGAADNVIVLAYLLTGPLHPQTLGTALNDVVAAHPALRTVYPWLDVGPVQRVLAPHEAVLGVEDVAAPPGVEGIQELAEDITADWWTTPFFLDTEAPLRARLCRVAADRHLLCLQVHHIAFDGWSESVLMGDLGRAYALRLVSRPPALGRSLSYGEFSRWEASRLADWASRDLPFWKRELARAPAPFLPPPRRAASDRPVRRERVLNVAAETVRRLGQAAARRGGPVLAALLAGAARALARTFDAEELTVGSVTAGRFDPVLEPVVGYFVNPFALVLSQVSDSSAEELLDHAVDRLITHLQHVHTPFDELVRVFAPPRGRHPWFQTWVVLQGQPPHVGLGDHVMAEPVRVRPPNTEIELMLEAIPAPDGSWDLVVLWRADGITAAQVGTLIAELHTALAETADCA